MQRKPLAGVHVFLIMTYTLSVAAFASTVVFSLSYRFRPKWLSLGESFARSKKAVHTDPEEMSKEEVLELRKKHFLHNVSISYANSDPLMIVKGDGTRLIDETGKSYLDTRNNVAHIGHEHPRVAAAVQRQVAKLNTNTRYLHPNVVLLAKRLVEKLPDGLNKVVFVNSGSEANDLALRLARSYSGSSNTIVVDGAYHGHTLSVLEVSPYKYEHSKEFALSQNGPFKTPNKNIWKVPCPDTYRGKHQGSNAGVEYAKYVEEACVEFKRRGQSVGAFIIEGGMSVGGVIIPQGGYLKKSVDAVRSAGGVYIADEVQTGFGRLGSCYWAFEHGGHGVVPDIVTVGKPFGNGMPLAAVITTEAVAEAFKSMNVEYFATFGGNPVSAAAGLAVLDVMEKENLQHHALTVGNYLVQKFLDLKSQIGLIGDIRGSGLFIGIELVQDPVTKAPATGETSYICTQLKQEYSILTSIDGFDDNVLVVKPPLVFSKADVDTFVDAFEKAAITMRKHGGAQDFVRTPT